MLTLSCVIYSPNPGRVGQCVAGPGVRGVEGLPSAQGEPDPAPRGIEGVAHGGVVRDGRVFGACVVARVLFEPVHPDAGEVGGVLLLVPKLAWKRGRVREGCS